MKKYLLLLLAVLLMLSAACTGGPEPTVQTDPTPTETTGQTEAVTQPPTRPPVITGWVEQDGKKQYYLSDGTPAAGWTDVDGSRYFFAGEGEPSVGWLQQDGRLYFLGMDGVLRTGWIESDGKRYYMDPENGGAAHTGWLEWEGLRYRLDDGGVMQTGWLEDAGRRYYLDESGVMQTGWLTLGQTQYYLKPDGSLARGEVEIDGKTRWFTSLGTEILLVNPWNYVPQDYQPELVSVGNGHQVDRTCYEDLMQMLADCRAAGLNPQVASSYRTHDYQVYLYNRKVKYYLDRGYSEAEAKKRAATVVAVPDTSEHQLGLALDLVDNSNWKLDESQEKTPVQQWLMKNSWRYGFILRYPNGKSDVTGIIYEPWHYRYVGKEHATAIYDSGLCLEEYLEQISAPGRKV